MTVPTVLELMRRAEETRDQARLSTHPDLRAHLLQVANEYERLAKRAEQFEERTRIGASNDDALKNWLS